MARMARTVRTTAVTVSTASAMLSPESACVTRGFMAPSKSKHTSYPQNSSATYISWGLNERACFWGHIFFTDTDKGHSWNRKVKFQ